MSWVIKSTDDIELAIVEWQKLHPEAKAMLGLNEVGLWWNDADGSTHLEPWDEIAPVLRSLIQ